MAEAWLENDGNTIVNVESIDEIPEETLEGVLYRFPTVVYLGSGFLSW